MPISWLPLRFLRLEPYPAGVRKPLGGSRKDPLIDRE